MIKGVLVYCRPGYEADVGFELEQLSAQHNCYGYTHLRPAQGYLYFEFYQPQTEAQVNKAFAYEALIFARQLLLVLAHFPQLDRQDRLQAIFSYFNDHAEVGRFQQLVLEYADTESGNELATLAKKLAVPMRSGLRQQQILSATKQADNKLVGRCLHFFLQHGEAGYLALSLPGNRHSQVQGIMRLKFPSEAPSRSTLKLDEAILSFLTKEQQATRFAPGRTAVDLGACPGGWTYQLVRRGVRVEAVDNGMVAEHLMATGLIEHFQADGFKYQPQHGHVDWLVCDMIAKPQMVTDLVADWVLKGWCDGAIINLKLPMKQRAQLVYQELAKLKARLTKHLSSNYQLQAKHLYHDRDEITFCLLVNR